MQLCEVLCDDAAAFAFWFTGLHRVGIMYDGSLLGKVLQRQAAIAGPIAMGKPFGVHLQNAGVSAEKEKSVIMEDSKGALVMVTVPIEVVLVISRHLVLEFDPAG